MVVLCLGANVSVVIVFFVINLGYVWLSSFALAILGAFILPIIGLGYSIACELTFPIGEGIACGVLMMVASILSTVFTTGITYVIDIEKDGYLDGKWIVLYLLEVSCAASFIISLFVKINASSKERLELKSSSFSVSFGHAEGEDAKLINPTRPTGKFNE